MAGRDTISALVWHKTVLAKAVDACPRRDILLRTTEDRRLTQPIPNQDAAALKAIANAELLLRRRVAV